MSGILTSDEIAFLEKGHDLSQQVENELMKLFNNDDIDEKFVIDNMDYLKDISPTIEALRTEYCCLGLFGLGFLSMIPPDAPALLPAPLGLYENIRCFT